MATLIAVYNSEGLVGRCSTKCYEAPYRDCDCICGGKNHSANHQQALAKTTKLAEQWIEAFAEKHDLTDCQTVVPARDPRQLMLW